MLFSLYAAISVSLVMTGVLSFLAGCSGRSKHRRRFDERKTERISTCWFVLGLRTIRQSGVWHLLQTCCESHGASERVEKGSGIVRTFDVLAAPGEP